MVSRLPIHFSKLVCKGQNRSLSKINNKLNKQMSSFVLRLQSTAFPTTNLTQGAGKLYCLHGLWGWGVHAHPLSLCLPSRTEQSFRVRSSWEGRYTPPISTLSIGTLLAISSLCIYSTPAFCLFQCIAQIRGRYGGIGSLESILGLVRS